MVVVIMREVVEVDLSSISADVDALTCEEQFNFVVTICYVLCCDCFLCVVISRM